MTGRGADDYALFSIIAMRRAGDAANAGLMSRFDLLQRSTGVAALGLCGYQTVKPAGKKGAGQSGCGSPLIIHRRQWGGQSSKGMCRCSTRK
jgi:hypothetical protein